MLKLETLFYGGFEKRDESRHDKTVPYYIFAVATEGRYELFAGEEYADCAEGEAFFTAPNVPLRIFHRLNPDSGRMRVRYLHFRLLDERGLDLFAFRRVPLRIGRETAERIDRHVAELCRLPKEKGTPEKIREMREAFAAVSILETLFDPADPNLPDFPPWLLDCLERIARAKGVPVAPAELYRRAGLSRSGFYRKFREFTGMSPAQYLLHARIGYAAGLLVRRPELSVKEISALCGWRNPYHFGGAFRKVMNASPGYYRTHPFGG